MGAARATHRWRLPATAPARSSSALALAACNNPIGGGGRRRRRRRRRSPNLEPDSRGVITYATYQVAVARDGDTLDDRGARGSGTTPAALAAAQRPARRLPAARRARCCCCPTAWPRPADGRTGGWRRTR